MGTYLLIHTHGIESVDYSSMTPDDLPRINAAAVARELDVVPGVFLAREYISGLTEVARRYHDTRSELPAIHGFSIEGPLLGTVGGVPPRGIWAPHADEWARIAELGRYGLRYVVIGPDGHDLDGPVEGGVTLRDVIDLLYANGVRIALGHFQHSDPQLSAARTLAVIDHVQRHQGGRADALLTDHLYNDMPRNFRHAWRTEQERRGRDRDLIRFLDDEWHDENLERVLGPVPATLIRAAHAGRLLPFLNFDGDHVDLAVCARTLQYLGPERLIGITDDTEIPFLAGEVLDHRPGSRLWYRSDGIVAAGTGGLDRQQRNLAEIGHGRSSMRMLFDHNPRRVLAPMPAPTRA